MSAPAPVPPVLLVELEPGGRDVRGNGGPGTARLLPATALTDPPVEGRVVELGRLGRTRLRPGVAVVLGEAVGPDSTEASAGAAVAASFLCVRVEAGSGDGALLVDEAPLPAVGEGVLRLDLDGRRLADVPVELPGRLPARLAELGAGPGLAAGQVVAALAADRPARAGVLQLTGPGGRCLVAGLLDRVPDGRGEDDAATGGRAER